MIELYSKDINILDRWESILKDYDTKEVDKIAPADTRKIILVDFFSCSKEFFDFCKREKKHNIDFIVLEGVPKVKTAKMVFALGAKAYGNSFMLPIHLVSCVETVKSGDIWAYPEFTLSIIKEVAAQKSDFGLFEDEYGITKREKEIIELVVNGSSNAQIAEKLNISVRTVKVHLSNIFQKLNVSNRLELATLFYSA